MLFILAQICGLIVLVLTVISVHFKTKEQIVMCFTIANVFMAIQYFLLGALTGTIISILNAIRCVVFYFFKRKDMKPSFIILLIFEIMAVISGVISWQNMWSFIPIVVTVIYTYGLWQDNIKVIRIATGIAGFGWAVYNVAVRAYVGAIQQTTQFMSAMIALYRNKNEETKGE